MIKALDENNDIFLEDGQIHRIDDGAEVVQEVRSRLLLYLDEWFLDTSVGVDYFGVIFVKPVDLSLVESELKSAIIDTENVSELISFELDFNSITRLLSVAFEAETTFGVIIKEEVTING